MRLVLAVRDLLLASWKTDRESVARVLPPGVAPADVEGDDLVSVVALRYGGGRLGAIPVPPFAQLNVRTYALFDGEPAVFFLRAYVTAAGMAGALFGAPYRPARLRLSEGRADAPGMGLSIAYRCTGPGAPGALGRHDLALFEAGGLRSFRVVRGHAEWTRAVPLNEPRADVLLALGFRLAGFHSLLHTGSTSFAVELPPRRVR